MVLLLANKKRYERHMFEPKRLARLKWACRRGMLELDVLLLPFVEEAFDSLSYEDQEKIGSHFYPQRLIEHDLYRLIGEC